MVEFNQVLETQRQAEAYMARTGGLPEITRASQDLRAALEQTREEIGTATYASRFLNPPGDHFKAMVSSTTMSHRARELTDAEGEAGHKRAAMESQLDSIEANILSEIHRLVALRCDNAVSQIEF